MAEFTAEFAINDLRVTAEQLVGAPVDTFTPARAGGNNRIYRVESRGRCFALKLYPPQARDSRDRLGAEFAALRFMNHVGVSAVPRAFVADPPRHCALYEWIEGAPIRTAGRRDIDAMAAFLLSLQGWADHPEAVTLPAASAACFSAAMAVRQFEQRYARLAEVADAHPSVATFLGTDLRSRGTEAIRRAERGYEQLGLRFDTDLPAAGMILSPSDFGLHNMLRQGGHSWRFLDFEYFGWDDPVKAVADALLHPGSALAPERQRQLYHRLLPGLSDRDKTLPHRLALLWPVYGMIWCLILLNEFLPERWARRRLADPTIDDALRDRQLDKARRLLSTLEETCPWYP